MLQIIVIHENNTTKVREIKDSNTLTVLSQFDEQTQKTDLTPLKSHIGEQVIISHLNKVEGIEGAIFDYEHIRTITEVNQDKDGIWYVEYN